MSINVNFPVSETTTDKVYDDFSPTAKAANKLTSRILTILTSRFANAEVKALGRELVAEEAKNELIAGYKAISPEKIIQGDDFIALPVIQTITDCMDNKLLREMSTSLLVNSMNVDYKHYVHPAFADIIKQLSPIDAYLIKNENYLKDYCPIIRIFKCEEKIENDFEMTNAEMPEFFTANYKTPVFSNYSLPIDGDIFDVEARSISIFNLHRLGLINVGYVERIIKPNSYKTLYNDLKTNETYYKIPLKEAIQDNQLLGLTRGYVSPTEFGKLFYLVCCS